MRPAEPGGAGRGPRVLLRAGRHHRHAVGRLLVAGSSGQARLGHAGAAGSRGCFAGGPAAGADAHHRDPDRVHARDLAADLSGGGADARACGERVGALRDHPGRLWAVLLPQGPARRVRGRWRDDACRRPGLGPVAGRDDDRPAADGARPAAGALLQRARGDGAGAAGPGRACRAGAVPACRAGQGGGTRPAGRRDARCRDPPGEPDGAASGSARHHRDR